MTLKEIEKHGEWNLQKHHPDQEWLKQFDHWDLTPNLTYRYDQGWKLDAKTRRKDMMQLFGELARELTGLPRPELLSWYVRWQIDENDRIHAHGVLGSNEKVSILKGRRNQFTGYPDLMAFLGRQWKRGSSFFQPIHDQNGWINYITRPNNIQETWTSPSLNGLKNQWLEGRVQSVLANQ